MTIEELETKITEARDAYYNTGNAIMSDADYDDLEDQLKTLDPANPLFDVVSEDSSSDFKKAKHTMLMGSQSKCNTAEEIVDRLKHFSGKKNALFLVEDKHDGISIEMNYVHGKATQHITRGNGIIGDDITDNVAKMMGVPAQLKDDFTGCVRGEILLFHSDKDKYYPDLKNCRNGASGLSKRIDGEGCEHLTVISYDAQYLDPSQTFETEAAILEFLTRNGFRKTRAEAVIVDLSGDLRAPADQLMQKMNKMTSDDKDFDTDGVVVKLNIIDENDKRNEVRPKTQWAIKPARVEVETTLLNIEWNMTNGTLVPVAVFEPVELDGATIQRASLSNVSQIEQLGIEIGDKIIVSRRNMVIPHVERKA